MGKLIAAGCTGALIALSAMIVTTAVAQAPKPNVAATSNLVIAAGGGSPVAWVLDQDKRTVFVCINVTGGVNCSGPGRIP